MTAVESTDGWRYGAMDIFDCVRSGALGFGNGDCPKSEVELPTGMLLGHVVCPSSDAPKGIGEVMSGTGLACGP